MHKRRLHQVFLSHKSTQHKLKKPPVEYLLNWSVGRALLLGGNAQGRIEILMPLILSHRIVIVD